jgi:CHAD domain-containing protein
VVSTNGRVPTEQVEGLVEATNPTGLKIAGAWVNVSRFKPVTIPDTGAYVRVDVDSRGYIRDLDVLKPAASASSSGTPTERDERIARLAVLKAAATFAAERVDIKSADVLRIAESWLRWVERED